MLVGPLDFRTDPGKQVAGGLPDQSGTDHKRHDLFEGLEIASLCHQGSVKRTLRNLAQFADSFRYGDKDIEAAFKLLRVWRSEHERRLRAFARRCNDLFGYCLF